MSPLFSYTQTRCISILTPFQARLDPRCLGCVRQYSPMAVNMANLTRVPVPWLGPEQVKISTIGSQHPLQPEEAASSSCSLLSVLELGYRAVVKSLLLLHSPKTSPFNMHARRLLIIHLAPCFAPNLSLLSNLSELSFWGSLRTIFHFSLSFNTQRVGVQCHCLPSCKTDPLILSTCSFGFWLALQQPLLHGIPQLLCCLPVLTSSCIQDTLENYSMDRKIYCVSVVSGYGCLAPCA